MLQKTCSRSVQIIFADGGSTDNTVSILKKYGMKVVRSARGRAVQMNAGAAIATGGILIFLHVDSALPDDWETMIQDKSRRQQWGFFKTRLTGKHILFRIIEYFMNLRSCLTGIATGDKGIFVEKKLFISLGGYPEIPLMEDVALSVKLKKYPRVCLQQKIVTSSRKWETGGILHTVLLMWKIRLLYYFGKSPTVLARMYYGK